MESGSFKGRTPYIVLVMSLAACVVTFLVSQSSSRLQDFSAIPLRQNPIALQTRHITSAEPRHHRSRVCAALRRLQSPDIQRWAQLVHQLRLWGAPTANGSRVSHANDLLPVVLNAEKTASRFGTIHILNRHGLTFAAVEEVGSGECDAHPDKTLSVLGQIGIPTDQQILIGTEACTVGNTVYASLANFTWQQELPFSAIAFALYLPPENSWRNKYGDAISLSEIADRLCDIPFGTGACNGVHNIYAITAILNVDETAPILSQVARARAIATLNRALALLRENQSERGSWNASWFLPNDRTSNLTASENDLRPMRPIDEIVVTGHTLEWLVITPKELSLDESMIVHAIDFLIAEVLRADAARLEQNQTVFSHVGCALRDWFPDAFETLAEDK